MGIICSHGRISAVRHKGHTIHSRCGVALDGSRPPLRRGGHQSFKDIAAYNPRSRQAACLWTPTDQIILVSCRVIHSRPIHVFSYSLRHTVKNLSVSPSRPWLFQVREWQWIMSSYVCQRWRPSTIKANIIGSFARNTINLHPRPRRSFPRYLTSLTSYLKKASR